jgi:hypothetical protein
MHIEVLSSSSVVTSTSREGVIAYLWVLCKIVPFFNYQIMKERRKHGIKYPLAVI